MRIYPSNFERTLTFKNDSDSHHLFLAIWCVIEYFCCQIEKLQQKFTENVIANLMKPHFQCFSSDLQYDAIKTNLVNFLSGPQP